MKKTKEEKKLTLEEYQAKYCKPQNTELIKSIMFIAVGAIGLIVAIMLFLFVKELFSINQYAGYVGIGVAILAFIFLYIVPVIKINNKKAFMTNVNELNAAKAKKYNKKMREDIADKMIDLTLKTEGVGWYSVENVTKLANARNENDNEALKLALSNVYDTDVKDVSNKMIRDAALKVGFSTALSQSDKLDTMFICVFELSMIKQIVYLYGFRPSDAKMLKIYESVIVSALMAYGVSGFTGSMATTAAQTFGKVASGIPVLGQLIGTVVGSVSQGVINSMMTVIIGFQTKKYLMKEYNLQNILDTIEFSEEEEAAAEEALMREVKDEVGKKDKAPKAKGALVA